MADVEQEINCLFQHPEVMYLPPAKRCLSNEIFHNTNWLVGERGADMDATTHVGRARLPTPEDWQCPVHLGSSDCIIQAEK